MYKKSLVEEIFSSFNNTSTPSFVPTLTIVIPSKIWCFKDMKEFLKITKLQKCFKNAFICGTLTNYVNSHYGMNKNMHEFLKLTKLQKYIKKSPIKPKNVTTHLKKMFYYNLIRCIWLRNLTLLMLTNSSTTYSPFPILSWNCNSSQPSII